MPNALADHLCDLVRELTRHRPGGGPHWLMIGTVARELRRHGIDGDLEAAITICCERRNLKAEGFPGAFDQPVAEGLAAGRLDHHLCGMPTWTCEVCGQVLPNLPKPVLQHARAHVGCRPFARGPGSN